METEGNKIKNEQEIQNFNQSLQKSKSYNEQPKSASQKRVNAFQDQKQDFTTPKNSKKLYIELEKLISQKEQENSQSAQNQLDFASTQKKYVKKLRETDFSLPEKLSQPNSQRESKDCLFYKFIANSQKPLKKRKDPVFTGNAMSRLN
ncbi:hypothetical protein PPERSA_03935 [Pseudocohnilembus persalinus]|uniref:Uncharacterized protein n=1 Tax=Pseudocohnilembus persalinus TaxID=266149 RepID=A0A0V0R5V1_PSEPJ|nr:hypothetical protein PPERSA_03935 [Pseudocohnilembus persalinus]|eukprot:KRX09873.1 hypothetical protein PPERSA_03935 [Pseudocohnilembus persalinus]